MMAAAEVFGEEVRREPSRAESKFRPEPYETIEPVGLEFIAKGAIPARGVGFCAGPSMSGKTVLMADTALRIAQGQEVFGCRTRQVGVIYVASEAANGLRKRVKAWRQENPGAAEFLLIPQAVDLQSGEDVEDLIAAIRRAAEAMSAPVGLVLIDTLAASMPGGNDNDTGDMTMVLARLQAIGDQLQAFVMVVAHTGKDETRGIRGSSAQFAGADLVMMVTMDDADDGVRVATIAKLKEGEAGRRIAFRLRQVELGQDSDGDPITSIVPEFVDAPGKRSGKLSRPLSSAQQLVMRGVRLCIEAGQVVPVSGPGVPPGATGILRAVLKAKLAEIGFTDGDENPDTVRRTINRAIVDLISRQLLRATDVAVWSV